MPINTIKPNYKRNKRRLLLALDYDESYDEDLNIIDDDRIPEMPKNEKDIEMMKLYRVKDRPDLIFNENMDPSL